MSERLIIRADASTRMGSGHVMRCIALGQAWQDAGGSVSFVSHCDSEGIKKRIREEGFDLVELSGSYPDLEEDLPTTLSVAGQVAADWVVVDGYHFDLAYQKAMRAGGFRLLCVDDYNHLEQYEADILLNQNIGAEGMDYNCNADCMKKLGIKHVLLRREFRVLKPKAKVSNPICNILLTFGGSDPDNATSATLEAFWDLDCSGLHVKVLVGPSNPHAERIFKAAEKLSAQVEVLSVVKDMPNLLKWADFAISAAGSTCWELVVAGIPFATVVVAENQMSVADGLENRGIAPSLGWVDGAFRERLVDLFKVVLNDFSVVDRFYESVAGRMDCFGVDRILCRMESEGIDLYGNRLLLRQTGMDDAMMLMDWANDPATRANSFNSKPIDCADHIAWLKKKLKSEDSVLMILELDGTPCGHIRYDREDNGGALLSFVLAPSFRGMKLGRQLLESSREMALNRLNAGYIKAITFVENKASSRIFEGAGFEKISPVMINGRACNEFVWRKSDGG